MNQIRLEANEAINDVLDIIAGKEREITMLKIQVAALTRMLPNEEVENNGDDVVPAG